MTDRLYYKEAYTTDFKARVVSTLDDGVSVVLDRTAFYPTSGGQPFDTGKLNDSRVVDVKDEGEQIVHVLDVPLTSVDVTGCIDWTRRFDHMQQHTGQHLLSAIFGDLFGFRTASVHFGAESSSIDLETPELTRDQILAAELQANVAVTSNVAVQVSFEDSARVQGLRKPPPRDGEIRVVSIAGLDRSACGGTHVRATGEIGPLLLGKLDKMHGNARIEFVCGQRAIRRARSDYDGISRAAAAAGAAPHELVQRVTALVADTRDAERVRRKLGEELAQYRAEDLYNKAQPDASGVRWVVERIETGAADDLRALALAVMGRPQAVFLGTVASSGQMILAASEDSGVDAGKVLKTVLAPAGGRGGGSARLAQGSVTREKLPQVVDEIRRIGEGAE